MNNFNISMDEYFATIRTNYFRVSDAEAFEEWIGRFDLEGLEQERHIRFWQNGLSWVSPL